jgi:hypothetical protein
MLFSTSFKKQLYLERNPKLVSLRVTCHHCLTAITNEGCRAGRTADNSLHPDPYTLVFQYNGGLGCILRLVIFCKTRSG